MNLLWNDLAARASIALSDAQTDQLNRYLDLLFAANERMNLTRIVDRPSAELQHVADALTVLPFLPKEPHAAADVGSGGGVPGIPLAIARPDVHVTLIESTKKKAAFLRETAAALGLSNVSVLDIRVEEAAGFDGTYRERMDVTIARAVAAMAWLAEWCLPLTKVGGKMLAMKGAKVAEELPLAGKAIKLTGGDKPVVHPVELPGSDHRVIVEIAKVKKSDLHYPRPPTSAKGKPIY